MARMRPKVILPLLLLASLALVVETWGAHMAHAQPTPDGIDMVIVIDNSGSMFEYLNAAGVYDTRLGSDPEKLRIVAANIIVASLGQGEPNPDQFQIGIISLGYKPPEIISPLVSLGDTVARDKLSRAVANPSKADQTQIVAALEAAYDEMSSERHITDHKSAIVLLTDGEPYPSAGQSEADLKALVQAHPDVPLYLILLQNPEAAAVDPTVNQRFRPYILFWNQMADANEYVKVLKAQDDSELLTIYDSIVQDLQGFENIEEGIELTENQSISFTVNDAVQRVSIKIVKPTPRLGGATIQDASGRAIQDSEPGVFHYISTINPVETFVLTRERLADQQGEWTITSNVADTITVTISIRNLYRIEILSPDVHVLNTQNDFTAGTTSFSPSGVFPLRLQIVDDANRPLRQATGLTAQITDPAGETVELPETAFARDPNTGVYAIDLRLDQYFPRARERAGVYRFRLLAQPAGLPATATLRAQIGLRPYLDEIAASALTWQPDQPLTVRVLVGDYDTSPPGNLVRVSVINLISGQRVALTDQGPDATLASRELFEGDVASLLPAGGDTELTIRLEEIIQGAASVIEERQAALTIVGPTPSGPTLVPSTPVVTLAPGSTATPLPPPVCVGNISLCVERSLLWPVIVGVILLATLLLLLILLPPPRMATVMLGWFGRLPAGYIRLQCEGIRHSEGYDVLNTARRQGRWGQLTIGPTGDLQIGDKKEKKPEVLTIVWRDNKTFLVDNEGTEREFKENVSSLKFGKCTIWYCTKHIASTYSLGR